MCFGTMLGQTYRNCLHLQKPCGMAVTIVLVPHLRRVFLQVTYPLHLSLQETQEPSHLPSLISVPPTTLPFSLITNPVQPVNVQLASADTTKTNRRMKTVKIDALLNVYLIVKGI